MKQPQETNVEYIDYMIVVHGIGDQRPNETILPVINRIAELRHGKTKHGKKAVVTLGMVTSQTGLIKRNELTDRVSFSHCKPWSEFKKIPANKDENRAKKLDAFYGEPSHDGSNIRFVDMYWADIMEAHYKHVNEPLKDWADSLIGRLEVRQKHGEMPAEEGWILPILYRLEETLTVVETLMSLKTPGVSQEIFDKYLGDVQIYGEYLSIRGEAVYRFHRLFDKIEEWHKKDHNLDDNYLEKDSKTKIIRPRYTIIAHSLGTIMSLDALMYAHMRKDVLDNNSHIPNVPFPNYQHDNEETIATTKNCETIAGKWIDNIDSFITLGSPIDKYLTLWWKNYNYLDKNYFFAKPKTKINHYNYCDEQDPVGHSLDLIGAKDSFNEIFESREDLVYNRYIVPGAAHTKYWTDINLFEHILNNTIDAPRNNPKENLAAPSKKIVSQKVEEQEEEHRETPISEEEKNTLAPFLIKTKSFLPFEGSAYAWVLFFSYFFFGMLSITFSTVTLFWTFSQKDGDFISITLGSLAFVLAAYVFFRFIKMMIWWRQVVKLKKKSGDCDIKQQRSGAIKFKLLLYSLVIVHYVAAVLFLPTLMEGKENGIPAISLEKLFFVGVAIVIVTFLVYIKFHIEQNVKFKDTAMTWTVIYTIFLTVSVLIYHLFLADIFKISLHFGERFNILLAVYLVSATITWMYTYLCFNASKRYLTRISKKIKKEEIKQQMQEGLELV